MCHAWSKVVIPSLSFLMLWSAFNRCFLLKYPYFWNFSSSSHGCPWLHLSTSPVPNSLNQSHFGFLYSKSNDSSLDLSLLDLCSWTGLTFRVPGSAPVCCCISSSWIILIHFGLLKPLCGFNTLKCTTFRLVPNKTKYVTSVHLLSTTLHFRCSLGYLTFILIRIVVVWDIYPSFLFG